jgi:iron complex transport system permease protein
MKNGERKTGFFGRIKAVLSAFCRFLDRARLPVGFTVLGVLLILFALWNIAVGSTKLTAGQVLDGLFNVESPNRVIVMDMRMVRVVPAILLGGALALSGFLLQTFFANPIAGPFILGVSSGAKLVMTIAMILLVGRGVAVGSLTLILAAFLGAMLSMGFVLAVSYKVKRMSLLVICGVMIGYICSAITELIVQFADESHIVKLHDWAMGSFARITWPNVAVMTAVVLPALVLTFLLSKPIGAYQLGEVYAKNMGVNIRAFRVALILLSGVLSACVTAFAGPISFVGVAVPHLMRRLFKTEKPIVMIPACFLGGAGFCLLCDLIARTIVSSELSISSVTAIFGAPIVILVMLRRQKEGGR